jgi:hypothetical protein
MRRTDSGHGKARMNDDSQGSKRLIKSLACVVRGWGTSEVDGCWSKYVPCAQDVDVAAVKCFLLMMFVSQARTTSSRGITSVTPHDADRTSIFLIGVWGPTRRQIYGTNTTVTVECCNGKGTLICRYTYTRLTVIFYECYS